jgi:hypothetical protein
MLHIRRQHNETNQTLFAKWLRGRKLREYNRGGELVQSILYAFMPLSQ